MPVEWQLHGAVLRLLFSGLVEREEIERALDAALADPLCRPGMGLLWDARRSATPLSADDVAWRLELAASLGSRGLVSCAAVLVTERWLATLDYFRATAHRLQPGFPLGMFTDEDDALAWLEADGNPPPREGAPR